MTQISIDQLIAEDNGVLVNNGGVQCVAIANEEEEKVLGGTFIKANWASDWWNYFNDDTEEKSLYVEVGASSSAQKGDLAVWSTYPTSGLPHIALVVADLGGAGISCFTQNPKPAHTETLVKTNLLGYLRPKAFLASVAPTPAPTNGVIAWAGTVKGTSAFNVRTAPTTQGNTPLHVDAVNTVSTIIGYIAGENVTENGISSNVWLEAWNHTYIWSGNTNWTGSKEI